MSAVQAKGAGVQSPAPTLKRQAWAYVPVTTALGVGRDGQVLKAG